MTNLDQRLVAGPLAVRTLWSLEETEQLAPQVLLRRRRRFFLRCAASAMSCTALLAVGFWAYSFFA